MMESDGALVVPVNCVQGSS